jgi:RND superfamily putative drug exporter
MLAFYLVFAVLYDTFVVRILVVPACMHLLGDLNWWPGKMPRVKRHLNTEDNFNDSLFASLADSF